MADPINIFIAYSHKDENYLNELRAQLRILERQGIVHIWHDGKIIAGQKWDAVIEDQLAKSDIFLMLLSADFINSDYAYGKEMTQALKRHERGEATIIPIIARDCAWELTPLAELQAPVQGKALSSVNAEQRQTLYKGIVLAIHQAVKQRQAEIKNQNRYFADEKAWDNALQLHSINAYHRYLKQHSQGGHAEEARQAIAAIKRTQEKEKQSIEQKAWQAAQRANTV
ncbi:MAG: toll/interleukin-1 receptor domain-containing protein, partial [Bacteroidota bacterium]